MIKLVIMQKTICYNRIHNFTKWLSDAVIPATRIVFFILNFLFKSLVSIF